MRTEIAHVALAISLAALGTGCASGGRRSRVGARQSSQLFQAEIRKTIKAQYLLYLPTGYAESKNQWPLILFLHGAGERGDDLEKVKIHGPAKLIAKEGREFPFVVVSPQCSKDGCWSSNTQIEMLDVLLNHIVRRYRIDQDRIYVTGLSSGAYTIEHYFDGTESLPEGATTVFALVEGFGDTRNTSVKLFYAIDGG